ncbi:hypothetical protein CC1G_13931 [Coprinopsis cinerea okayama7|uniref:Uncharacterized protein n=1 Tax=Coprinopsis cinerea (strain Okayama-7 / 130 / ATCC MYA-4618 / FGSC 9003) TaxID=240176 RepID=D6RKN9_COPC7|nr:hypothetical protein CC1G_13931 [Coprinopsis cinerea okayama7\|eukprot:XP_002911891.1 hypothetical protein CC1G_13931 [Coprinopsis cinerea okayama7\
MARNLELDVTVVHPAASINRIRAEMDHAWHVSWMMETRRVCLFSLCHTATLRRLPPGA